MAFTQVIKTLGSVMASMKTAVDSWLSANITNPSNPPLDRSLSLSNACAPADMVGDLRNEIGNNVVYVSNSGNDNNTGDVDHPVATVNKALEKGATRILISSGDYRQQIDLSKSRTGKVEILKASESGNVYFRPTSIQICATETKEDNYTKVYSAPITVTLAVNNKWLFQRNMPDLSTTISNTERMPQQRGYTYRLPSTIIRKCTSTTLANALNEIDNATDYRFYIDNGTIYFSRPTPVNGTTPIAYSPGTKLFLNNSIKNTIIMTGIKTEYMQINIDYTTNSVLTDCSAVFVYGNGAISYDYALNATFIRCEGAGCVNGTTGDGINGHGKTGGIVSNYKTTAKLFDCWCHDNNDDGFSDHDYCESEIYGGLFEYNEKAGVTPSYGSHCVCIGVYSRKNYNGYYYTGASNDGGVYGQLECINCIAEENTGGTSQNNAGFLVDSNGNKLILCNCKSINNNIGYYATSSASMKLIDCGSYGDTTPKAGGGTRTIIKTETIVP